MQFKITDVKARQESYSDRKREPYKYRNKMYIWPEGETIMENLMNRRDRPHTFYKKEIIPLVMKWRQHCGCGMCPCSPGFVSDKDGLGLIQVTVEFK